MENWQHFWIRSQIRMHCIGTPLMNLKPCSRSMLQCWLVHSSSDEDSCVLQTGLTTDRAIFGLDVAACCARNSVGRDCEVLYSSTYCVGEHRPQRRLRHPPNFDYVTINVMKWKRSACITLDPFQAQYIVPSNAHHLNLPKSKRFTVLFRDLTTYRASALNHLWTKVQMLCDLMEMVATCLTTYSQLILDT